MSVADFAGGSFPHIYSGVHEKNVNELLEHAYPPYFIGILVNGNL
jgi:hypothetical protein